MSKDVKAPAADRKNSDSSTGAKPTRKRQRRPRSIENDQKKKKYQAKLLLEEDAEEKTCLVKITKNSGVRQVINHVLPKLKEDWRVELNGFSMDISKVLHATEILKTRIPFLHQETRFISQTKEYPVKGNEESETKERTFSGLSVTLSKNSFEVQD